MLIRSPNGSYESVDFRETAPAAAFGNMYKDNVNSSVIGGLARYLFRKYCGLGMKADSDLLTVVCLVKSAASSTSTHATASSLGKKFSNPP